MTSPTDSSTASFPADDANATLLSLPSSFDDSLCLDLYRSAAVPNINRFSPDSERKQRSEQGGVDGERSKVLGLQSQVNGLSRQVLLLRDDLKSAQRETTIHRQRADRLENELRRAEESLESLGCDHEREVAELVRKTEREFQEAASHAKDKTKLLSDEKNNAIERLSLAQGEINDLKLNISSLKELNIELESQLEDLRRELRKSASKACDSQDNRFAELNHGISRLEHIVTRQQEEILTLQNDARRSEGAGHCNKQHPLSIHMFHHKTQRMKAGASSVKISRGVR